jgi:hypothetical protein
MQGYTICTFAGGWKYTLSDPKIVFSNLLKVQLRGAIVHTSQPKDKTGTLHVDICETTHRVPIHRM